MTLGRDLLVESECGTGKTSSYSIGMLNIIDEDVFSTSDVQGLILSPTKELSYQIFNVLSKLSEFMKVKICSFFSETSIKSSISQLNTGVHIIVGTPIRIQDLLVKKIISFNKLKMFILDEAEELISKGFLGNLNKITSYITNEDSQVGIFSSSIKKETLLNIVDSLLKDPIRINVNRHEAKKSIENIKQYYINTKEDEKIMILLKLYKTLDITQSFIYCNTVNKVEFLSDELLKRGFSLSSIHSDVNQTEREEKIRNYLQGQTRIMVTNDVLSKGVDISQIDLVVNFDFPSCFDTYINRIGRTKRFGKRGVSISFVTRNDQSCMKNIVKELENEILEYCF